MHNSWRVALCNEGNDRLMYFQTHTLAPWTVYHLAQQRLQMIPPFPGSLPPSYMWTTKSPVIISEG